MEEGENFLPHAVPWPPRACWGTRSPLRDKHVVFKIKMQTPDAVPSDTSPSNGSALAPATSSALSESSWLCLMLPRSEPFLEAVAVSWSQAQRRRARRLWRGRACARQGGLRHSIQLLGWRTCVLEPAPARVRGVFNANM